MRAHMRTHRGRYLLAVLILMAIGVGYALGYEKTNAQFVVVARGTISQEVVATGKLKSPQEVRLGFERSGKVARVEAAVGTSVAAGALLVSLEATDLYAAELEAQARLDAAHAKLAELERGTRPEEVRIAEVKVASASSALLDAQENLLDKIHDSLTKSDDAIHSKVDQLFSNPRSTSPQIVVATFTDKENRESERVAIEYLLTSWRESIATLGPTSDLEGAEGDGKIILLSLSQFLDHIASGVNALTVSSNLTQAAIDGYRGDIATARVNVNAAVGGLTAAKEKLRAARANLALAEEELRLKRAGPPQEELQVQAARVKEARASVHARSAEIQKTLLRAPFEGTVAIQDANVGEIVAANIPLVTLIGNAALEIEANIPEVDIGRVAVRNPVVVTIDALPKESFAGAVSFIEPAETVIDGVVNFKVKVSLSDQDPRIKSGLTANLVITTLKKSDVLILPQFAVSERNGVTFVNIFSLDAFLSVPVTLGVSGNNGMVEILEGLREGDKVVSGGN